MKQLQLGVMTSAGISQQVGDGFTDFVPSPLESRGLISRQYDVPETLLIRFSDDGIDETALVAPGLIRPGRGECPRAANREMTMEGIPLHFGRKQGAYLPVSWCQPTSFTPADIGLWGKGGVLNSSTGETEFFRGSNDLIVLLSGPGK